MMLNGNILYFGAEWEYSDSKNKARTRGAASSSQASTHMPVVKRNENTTEQLTTGDKLVMRLREKRTFGVESCYMSRC